MRKVEELLGEAGAFLKAAKDEFRVASAKNDVAGIRDSAEKAWNSVVQATNALLLALTERSHWAIMRGEPCSVKPRN